MLRKRLGRIKAQTDHLTYGRDIVAGWCRSYLEGYRGEPVRVLDIGCGRYAADLLGVRAAAPGRRVELFGVECDTAAAAAVEQRGVSVFAIDIERAAIPAPDATFDIVIANQVIEHTKEIFWVCSEISRVLRPGGILIVGVPNLASLHNRVLLLAGEQPTTIELLGPHVRGFTIPSFRRFIEEGGYFRLLAVRGANFYPFPPALAIPLSRLFPALAVSIFFLARREARPGVFIEALRARSFQTAYFAGPDSGGQEEYTISPGPSH